MLRQLPMAGVPSPEEPSYGYCPHVMQTAFAGKIDLKSTNKTGGFSSAYLAGLNPRNRD